MIVPIILRVSNQFRSSTIHFQTLFQGRIAPCSLLKTSNQGGGSAVAERHQAAGEEGEQQKAPLLRQ